MSWNGEIVLGIINPATDTFTCVGYAPSKNRRCQNAIAVANRHEVQKRIRALPQHFGNSIGLRHELSVIASKALCKHDHQGQTDDIAEQWSDVIARTLQGKVGGLNDVRVQGEKTVFVHQAGKTIATSKNWNIPLVTKSEPCERTWTTNKSQRSVKQGNGETVVNTQFKREQEVAQKARREARYQAFKRAGENRREQEEAQKARNDARHQALHRAEEDTREQEEAQKARMEARHKAFKRAEEKYEAFKQAEEAAARRPGEVRKRADDAHRRLFEVRKRADDANRRVDEVRRRLDEVHRRAEQEDTEKRDEVSRRAAQETHRKAQKAKCEAQGGNRGKAERHGGEPREAGQQKEKRREAEQQEEPRELEEAADTDRTPTEPEGEPICNDAWAVSWTRYERAWSKLSRVNNTSLDEFMRDSIPWPVRGGTLKEVTEADVEEFFYHAPQNITDWSGSFLQMLRLQLKRWHPDRVARALPLAQRSDEIVAKTYLVVGFIEDMVKDEEEWMRARASPEGEVPT
ncbi:hypothetical protein TI39_contig628g00002 [Zymoseptoria brevis]|uniref:Uncharacterized protein n=1 Tax=Zymoseptoria brevis TaxID=1047168 RepID=A0A0F4GG85_9PEZI|nr:hypothetical protein TI39_contig628g00002 [Zymoseptoria brevis]